MIHIFLIFHKIFKVNCSKPDKSSTILGINKIDPKIAKSHGLFLPSKYDPLIDQAPYNKNFDTIQHQGGNYEEHIIDQPPSDRFGDINLMTLNLATSISTTAMNQDAFQIIKEVLDQSHPTVFALQGIRESLMSSLRKLVNSHYKIYTDDIFTTDNLSAAGYFLPIIIDTKIYKVKKQGYIKNSFGVVYASYVEVEDLKYQKKATFINIDMYSTFKSMVEGEFFNIITDIKGSKEIASNPVFFMGGIGTLSGEIKTLLQSGYKNLVDHDKHNSDLDSTTVHGKVEHSDGVQRDFIILRDPKGKFTLNYARILSKFPIGEHYPIQGILSFTT